MTEKNTPAAGFAERAATWARRGLVALAVVAVVIVVYLVARSFLPRWWAQQVGHRIEGSFSGGVGIGLTVGFVCTFLPLLLIIFAIIWRRRWKNIPAIACGIGAVLTAIPNLLTLTVVFGTGAGADAGEQIMNVNAPAFRGASLWGAIGGAVLALIVGYFVLGYRRRGRKLREAEHPVETPEH